MILVIDNYDSFTYNLVQYLSLVDEVLTYRNDEIDCEAVNSMNPDCIVISPGPGTPGEAGVSKEVIGSLQGLFLSWACASDTRPLLKFLAAG